MQELIAPLRGGPLTVDLVVAGDEALAPVQTRLALFRVIQEGLTNIQRHAHARRAELEVDFTPQSAAVRIADNGVGFVAVVSPASGRAGYGLEEIQQRIALLGGTMDIMSAPGAGTVLMVSAPYDSMRSAKREAAP